MKIVNIHGYQGSAQNSAYSALEAVGAEIVSPQNDYERESPEDILGKLMSTVPEERPDMIVGTSLGGFFAAVLAARTGLPVILVNPCLMPFLHLPRLGYGGDVRPFMTPFGELARLPKENVRVIIGGSDEVIDTHEFAVSLFGSERVRVVPEGKHSGSTLPLKEFFGEMLKTNEI